MPERALTGQSRAAIIRGTVSSATEDAVVVLTTFQDGIRRSLCSATVVAPNLLLTARHCVSDVESSTACSMDGVPISGGGVEGDRNPHDLVVFVGRDGVVPPTDVETNGSARGGEIVVQTTTTICNDDVAFVVLDRELTSPVAPLRLGPPALDEKVAAVGWGIDETGALPKTREVRANLGLIGLGPAMYPDSTTYGYGDREFMLGESVCAGDSGSPALAASGAVVGVASRAGNGKARDPANQASTCMGDTAHAIYTHLGGLRDLVARAFEHAHEPMWLEGEPRPHGEEPAPPIAVGTPRGDTTTSEASKPPVTAPGGDPPSADAGCSMTPEPTRGAVEQAIGLVSAIALLARFRRRLKTPQGPEGTA